MKTEFKIYGQGNFFNLCLIGGVVFLWFIGMVILLNAINGNMNSDHEKLSDFIKTEKIERK